MRESNGMKKCPKCGNVKTVDEFYRSFGNKDGYQVWCKDCFKSVRAANRARHLAAEAERKGQE